ncbi:uncharacterized protein LOC120111626 [Phoenix dactylifera]|uniref:Uncharacterized protein LOC120111626 n=1 Tax=Phoenix dactylifera TaxID=42345 RepID=A0A8B9APC1_PHODC|nr:uncharacterized protein LOC120111626 [Phoenix dactylifera]
MAWSVVERSSRRHSTSNGQVGNGFFLPGSPLLSDNPTLPFSAFLMPEPSPVLGTRSRHSAGQIGYSACKTLSSSLLSSPTSGPLCVRAESRDFRPLLGIQRPRRLRVAVLGSQLLRHPTPRRPRAEAVRPQSHPLLADVADSPSSASREAVTGAGGGPVLSSDLSSSAAPAGGLLVLEVPGSQIPSPDGRRTRHPTSSHSQAPSPTVPPAPGHLPRFGCSQIPVPTVALCHCLQSTDPDSPIPLRLVVTSLLQRFGTIRPLLAVEFGTIPPLLDTIKFGTACRDPSLFFLTQLSFIIFNFLYFDLFVVVF